MCCSPFSTPCSPLSGTGRTFPDVLDDPYYGPDDALDVYHDDPECYEDESNGAGDWLLVGEVPGGEILTVPVTQSYYSGLSKVRPITVFAAPAFLAERYVQDKEYGHG